MLDAEERTERTSSANRIRSGGRDAHRGPAQPGGAGGPRPGALRDAERPEPGAALSRGRAPVPDLLPAGPRPGDPLLVLQEARVQDPGLREPRGRQLPHAADSQPGGGADRAHRGPDPRPQRGADGVPDPRARPRAHALRALRGAGDGRGDARPRRLRAQPADAADTRGPGGALPRVPRVEPDLGGAGGDHQAPPGHRRRRSRGLRAGGAPDARGPARRLRGRDRLQQPRR